MRVGEYQRDSEPFLRLPLSWLEDVTRSSLATTHFEGWPVKDVWEAVIVISALCNARERRGGFGTSTAELAGWLKRSEKSLRPILKRLNESGLIVESKNARGARLKKKYSAPTRRGKAQRKSLRKKLYVLTPAPQLAYDRNGRRVTQLPFSKIDALARPSALGILVEAIRHRYPNRSATEVAHMLHANPNTVRLHFRLRAACAEAPVERGIYITATTEAIHEEVLFQLTYCSKSSPSDPDAEPVWINGELHGWYTLTEGDFVSLEDAAPNGLRQAT